MQHITILKTDNFHLDSYGHGLAYVLANLRENRSIFIQGDAATEFRQHLEALERADPSRATDHILAHLWADYEVLADHAENDASESLPAP